MTRKHYPLQTNAFQCPSLSAKDESRLIQSGERALRQFLDRILNHNDAITWTSAGDQNGVRLLEGASPTFAKGLTCLRAISQVNATLEEVALLHAFETRDKCFEYMRHYASDILDIIPLYSFVKRTADHPLRQMYVKWVAVESPVPMIKNRDYLYIEAQNEFEMSNGRRGWAYCQSSLNLGCCPSLEATSLNLIRATLDHTGCVFLESETPGVLDVIYHMSTDFKGAIPPWVIKMALKRRARKITMINDYVHGLRLATQPLRSKDDVKKTAKAAKNCTICAKSFRFHRQKACQACSNAVCTSCSHSWRVNGGITGPTRARICTYCSDSVRDGQWEQSMLHTCRSGTSDSTGAWTNSSNGVPRHPSPNTDSGPRPIHLYDDSENRSLHRRRSSQRHESAPRISPPNKPTPSTAHSSSSAAAGSSSERMDLSYLSCYGVDVKPTRVASERPLARSVLAD
ncbi:hypothetical protein SDRG_08539 [Saprolegnia diclina VS20]|uniref:FYVE-type domain-containing protein n=1 Tax=Saprolegnia diclina (strain VS20) TaxID=1156394 RepID=T0RNC3_SAPDV|nr:hypothetical protein SDRG_08539 [Saprolegnia diclina VS20]EQC33858.1 hypothetical protein SDRG_08539 [Saprolegnia diclina VS20]|eukprot:XP_008612653.1 hypothetical protein SDRG_08539 [Saprolegnia diclina VS20]